MNHLKLQHEKLSVEAISELVSFPTCGAISLFVGTTRDNFEGKTVLQLDYEAYESMALKAMTEICNEIRTKWPSVVNIAIYHRLGTVPVKEASIVIAISAPHRADALTATEWCIDSVKKTVPIWKKEIYSEEPPTWKENAECDANLLKNSLAKANEIQQEVKETYVAPQLIQIKANGSEIQRRIEHFMERKREEINLCNIRDFCCKSENSCARVDTVLRKRKDSKGHLQVNRVYNTYDRDRNNMNYLMKHIPANGIEERLASVETLLSLDKPIPKNVYKRLRAIEDRLLYMESISPEYTHFWDKSEFTRGRFKKKTYTVDEIDSLILDLKKQKPEEQ